MRHNTVLNFILVLVVLGLSPVFGIQVFTTEEMDRIKSTLNQMTHLVEKEHEEILKIEEVLSTANTALRKARLQEKISALSMSAQSRLKDLRKLRSSFIQVPDLREFCIALDDRLQVMEKNLALIEELHSPRVLAIEQPPTDDKHWPSFINPGDPRYEMEEHQARLAMALKKGADVLTLAHPHRREDKQFGEFLGELDSSLKAEDKPVRPVVPVLSHRKLDEFHKQLEEARKKDPTYAWEEDRNDKDFRRFLQGVEGLHQKAMENVRVISNHVKVDEPELAASRKTFADLIARIDDGVRQREKKRVVLRSSGASAPVSGINKYMNDTRLDMHKPTAREFNSFLNELEPVPSEVVLKQGKVRSSDELLSVVPMYAEEDFMQYLESPKPLQKTSGRSLTFDRVMKEVGSIPPTSSLVGHTLGPKKSLLPITLTLLDDERQPYVSSTVEFVLNLPANQVVGGILESQAKDPLRHEVVTDENGEALVHLLMEAEANQLQVQRKISVLDAATGKLRCELLVRLAGGAEHN